MQPVSLTCATLIFIALIQISCATPGPQASQSAESVPSTVSPHPDAADTTPGAPPRYIDACQRTLFTAMWDGDAKAVQCYMHAGVDPNTPNTFDQRPGDHNGETILVDAVRHGYVEVVRVLVWAGADVNTSALLPKWDPEHGVDPTSWEPSQPLIFLALPPQPSERHFQILRVLLAAGADPNAKLTRRPDQNITLLVVAANNSAYRSMELLFTHRADPDVRPDGDSTLLWDAVSAGDANKTNVLLIGGADPMAIQFSSGSTVIDHAMALGNEDIIHILPGRSMRR